MIFRPKALRLYNERRERAVFPRLASPRIFLPLWILFCLLVIALITASLTKIPVYANGTAAEIERGPAGSPARLIAVLPAENFSDLKRGQKVFVRGNERKGMVRGEVSEVIPNLLTPAEIKSRFNFNVEFSTQLKTVAVVSLLGWESGEGPELSQDLSYRFSEVQIEVGSRRLFSLIH